MHGKPYKSVLCVLVCIMAFLICFHWTKRHSESSFRGTSNTTASNNVKGETSKKGTVQTIKYTSETVSAGKLNSELNSDNFDVAGQERLQKVSQESASSNGGADNLENSNKFQTEQTLRDSIESFHLKNFIKPPNEKCEKRLPTAIVIGVQKSGTRELIDFMHLHPHIQIWHRRYYEMAYFSSNTMYNRGETWFREQMPCSFSNQMTVMKKAGYFHDKVVPERIQKFNESIKLVLIVREPISRSYSAYTFF